MSFLLAFAAFCTSGYDNMLFSVGFVEEAGYKVAVFEGNFLVAHGTFAFFPWFWDRIAVRASAYGAKLVRDIHGAVNTAYKILAGQQFGVAKGARNQKSLCLGIFFPVCHGFSCFSVIFRSFPVNEHV